MTPGLYGRSDSETWLLDGKKELKWATVIKHDHITGAFVITQQTGCVNEGQLALTGEEADALCALIDKLAHPESPAKTLQTQIALLKADRDEQKALLNSSQDDAVKWAHEARELGIEKAAAEAQVKGLKEEQRRLLKVIAEEREACLGICESHGLIGEPGTNDTRVMHVNGVVKNIMQAIRNRGQP